MIIDKKLFFEIQNEFFSDISFNQTKEWMESTGHNENVEFFVDNIDKPEICFWARVFKRKFIGKHLYIDGITTNTNKIDTIRNFFLELSKRSYSIIELSDINIYNINYEIGLRQAGFIRPILSLSPLTIIVDLQCPFTFHRNWRRNVKKSEENEVVFELVENPTKNDFEKFEYLFNQLKDRKGLGFSISKNFLQTLLTNNNYKLFFAKDKSYNNYLSGRIIYIYNKRSYDVFAVNSNEGIKCGAAYFLQEKILLYLKELNINFFDYGRIPPCVDDMNNIYVSKSYSGGQPVMYNGQWVNFKNKKFGLLYEFYKFYYRKQKRF